MEKYDYFVIGSGPAGYVSAIRAAQLGLKVAVCEKDTGMFGGVCLNEGCIPAKALFRGAEVVDLVKRSPELCGIDVKYKCVNMKEMIAKSREAADRLSKGLLFLFKKNNIDLINGEAEFIDRETAQITGGTGEKLTIKADNFLIATGSTPKPLEGIPFDGKNVIDSSKARRLEKIPKKILIVGGGAIGTEFASYFNLLGAEVSIVEVENTLLPLEDREIARRFQAIFKQKGITSHTSSTLKEIKKEKHGVKCVIEGPEGEEEESCECVLVSVGRLPATSGFGLDRIGVKLDDKGFIPVNSKMQTNVENVYAAGDVLNTPMLAHVAYAEGEVAAEAAAGKDSSPIDYDCVPNATYSEVQVASVGITEEEAKSKNLDYKAGKQFFRASGKAVISSQTEGFIKVIADAASRKLLGAHILGHQAAELIHEFVLAKRAGLTVEDIARTIHAHPTFSEVAIDACRAVFDKPIHG